MSSTERPVEAEQPREEPKRPEDVDLPELSHGEPRQSGRWEPQTLDGFFGDGPLGKTGDGLALVLTGAAAYGRNALGRIWDRWLDPNNRVLRKIKREERKRAEEALEEARKRRQGDDFGKENVGLGPAGSAEALGACFPNLTRGAGQEISPPGGLSPGRKKLWEKIVPMAWRISENPETFLGSGGVEERVETGGVPWPDSMQQTMMAGADAARRTVVERLEKQVARALLESDPPTTQRLLREIVAEQADLELKRVEALRRPAGVDWRKMAVWAEQADRLRGLAREDIISPARLSALLAEIEEREELGEASDKLREIREDWQERKKVNQLLSRLTQSRALYSIEERLRALHQVTKQEDLICKILDYEKEDFKDLLNPFLTSLENRRQTLKNLAELCRQQADEIQNLIPANQLNNLEEKEDIEAGLERAIKLLRDGDETIDQRRDWQRKLREFAQKLDSLSVPGRADSGTTDEVVEARQVVLRALSDQGLSRENPLLSFLRSDQALTKLINPPLSEKENEAVEKISLKAEELLSLTETEKEVLGRAAEALQPPVDENGFLKTEAVPGLQELLDRLKEGDLADSIKTAVLLECDVGEAARRENVLDGRAEIIEAKIKARLERLWQRLIEVADNQEALSQCLKELLLTGPEIDRNLVVALLTRITRLAEEQNPDFANSILGDMEAILEAIKAPGENTKLKPVSEQRTFLDMPISTLIPALGEQRVNPDYQPVVEQVLTRRRRGAIALFGRLFPGSWAEATFDRRHDLWGAAPNSVSTLIERALEAEFTSGETGVEADVLCRGAVEGAEVLDGAWGTVEKILFALATQQRPVAEVLERALVDNLAPWGTRGERIEEVNERFIFGAMMTAAAALASQTRRESGIPPQPDCPYLAAARRFLIEGILVPEEELTEDSQPSFTSQLNEQSAGELAGLLAVVAPEEAAKSVECLVNQLLSSNKRELSAVVAQPEVLRALEAAGENVQGDPQATNEFSHQICRLLHVLASSVNSQMLNWIEDWVSQGKRSEDPRVAQAIPAIGRLVSILPRVDLARSYGQETFTVTVGRGYPFGESGQARITKKLVRKLRLDYGLTGLKNPNPLPPEAVALGIKPYLSSPEAVMIIVHDLLSKALEHYEIIDRKGRQIALETLKQLARAERQVDLRTSHEDPDVLEITALQEESRRPITQGIESSEVIRAKKLGEETEKQINLVVAWAQELVSKAGGDLRVTYTPDDPRALPTAEFSFPQQDPTGRPVSARQIASFSDLPPKAVELLSWLVQTQQPL